MNGNESLLAFINFILNFPKHTKITVDNKKLRNEFEFGSFDDNDIFYGKIKSHLFGEDKNKIRKNIESSSILFQRNLFAFLEYLRTLITKYNHEDLYKDTIVKLDISLIIGYLVNKYGAPIVEAIEFFPSCIKELEKKYEKNMIDQTIFDTDLKKDAKKKLEFLKGNKIENFGNLLLYLLKYYTTSKTYSQKDADEIDGIYSEYEHLTVDEIDNNYINDKKFKDHLEKYLESLLKTNGYDEENYKEGKAKELYEQKKKELKNHLFYSEILKVDLNNINDCMYLIYFNSKLYKDTPFYDTDEEFKKLLSRKEINDFTENLKKIIEDESFIKDLKEILNQQSVKDYFEKSRRFKDEEEDNYEIEFIEKEKLKDDDDYLKDGFDRFMDFINKDKYFFSKLFILKYLPKYKRAFVDPNMRIIINPLYFELSDSLDEKKRNEIFKAYLFIIILHEIVHLVKFMKEKNFQYSNIPQTPKSKEGGKMFINYLFNVPMICSINYKQALEVNKPENWNKPEFLSNIFEEQRKLYEERKKDIAGDISIPKPKEEDTISFYLSLLDDDNKEQISKNIIDLWYDID